MSERKEEKELGRGGWGAGVENSRRDLHACVDYRQHAECHKAARTFRFALTWNAVDTSQLTLLGPDSLCCHCCTWDTQRLAPPRWRWRRRDRAPTRMRGT